MSVGRPLRFLGLTVGGWMVARIVLSWPQADGVRDLIREITPVSRAEAAVLGPIATAIRLPLSPRALGAARAAIPVAPSPVVATRSVPPMIPIVTRGQAEIVADPPALLPQSLGPVPRLLQTAAPEASRWSGSGWAILRGGGMAQGLTGSQLGGAQGGVRIAYALDHARRVALAGRLTTPFAGAGREAAIGIDWRPTRLPVRIVAEHRFALDGGRGGPMVGLVGGINPTPIVGRLRLEAYAQAGAIARDGVEGFADGAVRVTHPIADAGGVRFDLGVGGWGGAQRGAARFDVGPSLGIVLPVAHRNLRLTLDWRERVAGDARPGSGPALSLGTDF